MKRPGSLSSVILWSVISAAFIGPGTVTTASSAGSLYQLDLLWCIWFATLACIILQEVSARLTIVSGRSMGQALLASYGAQKSIWLQYVLGGPVVLGCAAYEAGNILGAVSGIQLMFGLEPQMATIIVSVLCGLVLWTDRRQTIGWLMTLLVGLMGVAFFVLAWGRPFSPDEYLIHSLVPSLPDGSELLTLGLVGTTIVPYNIFLGSGISKGQTVPLMRTGLAISVTIGGLITAAILVAGTTVGSFSSFEELAQALEAGIGPIGRLALGIGLFAAGFSSAITSPYAASVISASVFDWGKKGQRLTWIFVLFTGFAFGVSGVKPIPVILTVQALNGLVLPLLTAFLVLLINDRKINPQAPQGLIANVILLFIFGCVLMMGLNNVDKSMTAWFGWTGPHLKVVAIATVTCTVALAYQILRPTRSTSL